MKQLSGTDMFISEVAIYYPSWYLYCWSSFLLQILVMINLSTTDMGIDEATTADKGIDEVAILLHLHCWSSFLLQVLVLIKKYIYYWYEYW